MARAEHVLYRTTLDGMSMIREATPADVPAIVEMIRELAEFEKLLHEVEITEALLHDSLFCDSPAVYAHIAMTDDGEVAGMAIWFLTYSTFLGRHGIYLEDLIVREKFRSQGIGKSLLKHLASVAVNRGYRRFEWAALDWNENAINFYKSVGAVTTPEWLQFRLTGDALKSVGS
jgi:GNAT superfamily N-acetyltransferase